MTPHDFMLHVDRLGFGRECWEWTGSRSPAGYGRQSTEYAHRVAYEMFVGIIPPGLFVLHHCDNPPCVRPSHLYVGTQQDNMRDMVARGRTGAIRHPERVRRGDQTTARMHPESQVRGAQHPLAKLTDATVRELRRRYPRESLTVLCAELGVSRGSAYGAATGETWRHVDEPPASPRYRKGEKRARAANLPWPLAPDGART